MPISLPTDSAYRVSVVHAIILIGWIEPGFHNPMIAELSALSAALCWAIGGLIAVSVVRRIGAVNYNHLRMLLVGGVLCLLLFALAQGKTGIVAALSSTAPVLILPLLWLGTRQRPAAAAWWGGVITVLGTGVLLLN